MNQLAINAIKGLQAALESPEVLTTNMEEYTNHFFAPGIYLRTLFVPAGFVVVSADHKYKTLNIILKGIASIVTASGKKITAKAPFIFESEAGQKAGFAVTDVWYASIYPNEDDIKNIKQLENLNTHTLEALS